MLILYRWKMSRYGEEEPASTALCTSCPTTWSSATCLRRHRAPPKPQKHHDKRKCGSHILWSRTAACARLRLPPTKHPLFDYGVGTSPSLPSTLSTRRRPATYTTAFGGFRASLGDWINFWPSHINPNLRKTHQTAGRSTMRGGSGSD
jgi:hypothetical protein